VSPNSCNWKACNTRCWILCQLLDSLPAVGSCHPSLRVTLGKSLVRTRKQPQPMRITPVRPKILQLFNFFNLSVFFIPEKFQGFHRFLCKKYRAACIRETGDRDCWARWVGHSYQRRPVIPLFVTADIAVVCLTWWSDARLSLTPLVGCFNNFWQRYGHLDVHNLDNRNFTKWFKYAR
jgi:hypothetical protein